jgi:phosphoadenosine phosphosulfate reductase
MMQSPSSTHPRDHVSALALKLSSTITLTERLIALRQAVSGRISFSTSLGLEDQVLLDAIVRTGIDVHVFTLDTGRHFEETYDTLAASELKYGRTIDVVLPNPQSVAARVRADGINGFRHSVEARKACCHVRKVEPLRSALRGTMLWLTGLRRDQSPGRAEVPFVDYDNTFEVLKANPLADWTTSALDHYIQENDVPINELHAAGYPSIGCQPCTRAVAPGEDIRAGRWWWENASGKECGLHNRPASQGSASIGAKQ